ETRGDSDEAVLNSISLHSILFILRLFGMFVSDSRAEVRGLAPLLEPGQQGWHFMLKPQISPWFHVTVIRRDEGFESRHVVFIDSLPTLGFWIEQVGGEMRLESLQLVSPGWLNGKQCWEMDVLAEIAQNLQNGETRLSLQDGRVLFFPNAKPISREGYSKVIYRLVPAEGRSDSRQS
ncbi:hypothetical protein, partial [Pseudomonas putida]